MSSETLVSAIGNWLVDEALGDPDIVTLFQQMCVRIVASGIPIDRGVVNWTTLHPLFQVEMVVWRRDTGASFEQIPFRLTNEPSEAWMRSPFRFLVEAGSGLMRRQLTGPNKMLDFQLLEDFAKEGLTDYLAFSTELNTPSPRQLSMRAGVLTSFATARASGFSDSDIEHLRRIHKRFGLVSKTVILSRIMRTLAGTYLGVHAGSRVLSGQIRHGDGETIPSVVWYSDLRHSTDLISSMDSPSFIELLNEYFQCTAGAVIAHGGDVLDFIGDGVLAIFPVTDGDERTAALAALAALDEAQERLRALNLMREAAGKNPIAFGVGISNGDVLFGNIGVAERLVFSVIGPTVNEVARVESLTKELHVPALATHTIASHAPDRWQLNGTHVLRGFEAPSALYTWVPPHLAALKAAS